MLTCEDKELLKQKGITEEQIAEQLACFEKGFPFLQLAGAASVDNNGIMGCLHAGPFKNCEVCACFGCGQPYVQEYVRISGCGL